MDKIVKSDEEWKKLLTPEQFFVLRGHGTEHPFTCEFKTTRLSGVYYCAACDLPLFKTTDKFDSGTGWPSFAEPVSLENLSLVADRSYGVERTEVRCARCDSHLGHVFDDGPKPSKKRYCINGVALKFVSN